MVKHFLKTLVIFTIMIGLGLLGVYLIGYFDKGDIQIGGSGSENVAK